MKTLWVAAMKLMGSARPRSRPMVANSIWPPSRTGIGRRFSTAKLTLRMIVNLRTYRIPASAAEWKTWTMPTGPETFDRPMSERGLKSPHTVRSDITSGW